MANAHSKPTNSFAYILPATCYPLEGINNISNGTALRLRGNCDSDENFKHGCQEYL